MRKLYLLKALADLFWFLSVSAIIVMFAFSAILLLIKEPVDIPIKINGEKIMLIDLISKLILLGHTIAYCFFVYGIFLFRKVLNHFAKRQIFEEKVIHLLNKIGKLFLTASLISGLITFFSKIYLEREAELGIGSGFDSFLFSASLGLFFMVLSEVFANAKDIKEENDLTI
ncbi:MAG TPA: DUF2975 domain-containing protein [Flavobacterium sp.]|jgi:hypothetical protein